MSARRWCRRPCAYCLISLVDPHIFVMQRIAAGLFHRRRGKEACSIRASRRRSTPTMRPSTRWWTRSSPPCAMSCRPRRAPMAAAAGPSSSAADRHRPQLRAVRDRGGRRRRPRHQGRRVGHHGQPEQCANRVDRDHRKRIPDPGAAFRAHPGFRRRGRNPRRPRHAARVSQSRRCALFHPLHEARDSAARRAGGGDGRTGDIVINPDSERETPADALRGLSAAAGRRVPPRHPRRRRLWRSVRRATPRRCLRMCGRAMSRGGGEAGLWGRGGRDRTRPRRRFQPRRRASATRESHDSSNHRPA